MRKKKTSNNLDGEITLEGFTEAITRVPTFSYSLNQALGGGLALRTAVEVYGYTHTGKSTFVYQCAYDIMKFLKMTKDRFIIIDTEGCSPEYIMKIGRRNGFSGKLWISPVVDDKGSPLDGGQQIDMSREIFKTGDCFSIFLDSVGGLQLPSTLEASVLEAKMGQRARIMGEYMRALVFDLRVSKTPAVAFLSNHAHPIIGPVKGTITTGGVAVSYLCSTRIRLTPEKRDENGMFYIQGVVEKLRYRSEYSRHRETFQFVALPDFGVHIGISAVQDCLVYGLATKDKVVKLGSKSFGTMAKLLDQKEDVDLFAPFVEALKKDG